MNLNQLYYFRELAEKQQYTQASNNLFISQPTLSLSIKQLEKELHCKLFIHNGRYVKLTKYGRQFYNTVVNSLNILDTGTRQLTQAISQDEGNINLACIPTSVGNLMPHIVTEYLQQVEKAPHFIYHDSPSLQICNGIKNGWYDIGICSYVAGFDNFTFIPLYTEEVIAICSKDNDLAQINEITPEELRGESIITYTKDITIGKDITNALLSQASDLMIANSMHDELAIAGQVLSNNMVGIVANTIYLEGFNLHKIKLLNIPTDTRQVYLVFNPESITSSTSLDFIDWLKANKSQINEKLHKKRDI
ncbi:LysR family transcriptional regulator [Lactobacillus mulieris]|jgi:transcriptional regulator, lysR family|nr:LysR family transcriptional regulator [Lactobacillus mulieris]KAA9244029.1 LysR family transcriptional regulator [Lactobacillus jensenii]MCW8124247.1 LysR family transcriptional regulator [Lactobacillus mulieris]MCZ9599393.1 LysR family transcriptional regulator [Lactobacillus mulieris]MDK7327462.1 LysR family transcriptional regulator [Lactobacillus mulieris]